jgi:hypothetical protein
MKAKSRADLAQWALEAVVVSAFAAIDMLLETVRSLQRAAYVPYAVLEQGDELEALERRFHPGAIESLTIAPETRIRGVYILRLEAR